MKDGSGRTVWQGMMQSKNAQEASDIWLNNFEMPKEREENSRVRGREANDALRAYQSGQYPNAGEAAQGGRPALSINVPSPKIEGSQVSRIQGSQLASIGTPGIGVPTSTQGVASNVGGVPGNSLTLGKERFTCSWSCLKKSTPLM